MRNRDFDHSYILQNRMPALQAKIDKINEKLKSAMAPLIVMTVSGPEIRRYDAKQGDYMSVMRVDLSRELQAPIGKIELLAATKIDPTTQFMEHRTFTKLTPEENDKIRNPLAPCLCDHCETNRLRVNIYTLKTSEGVKRVGSGCLDNFTGFKMIRWQEAYSSAVKAVEEAEQITFTDAAEHTVIPVETFLCEAIDQIAQSGYQSGYNGSYSTGMETFAVLRAKLLEVDGPEISYSPQTKAKAAEIKAFIIDSELNPIKRANDYYSNLRGLLNFGYLTVRQSGLLSSSIVSHDKEMAQLKEQSLKSTLGNTFYGTEGEKVLLKSLRVDNAYSDPNSQWAKTKITMYDDQGHMFVWNASGFIEVKKESIVNISGTLTKHNAWESKRLGKTMYENTLKFCKFHTLEEIEELIATPVKVKKPRKTKALEDSPSP